MGKNCYHFFPASPSPYNVFCPFCTFWSLFGHSRAFLSVPHFLALSSFVTNVIFTFLYVCTFTKKSPRFPFRKKERNVCHQISYTKKKDLMVRKKVRQSIGNQDFFKFVHWRSLMTSRKMWSQKLWRKKTKNQIQFWMKNWQEFQKHQNWIGEFFWNRKTIIDSFYFCSLWHFFLDFVQFPRWSSFNLDIS